MKRSVVMGFALLVAAAVVPTAYIELATRRHVVTPEAAPAVPWGVVFGAGLAPGGEPSPILAERLETALLLWRSGRVERLLLTGNTDPYHDEYPLDAPLPHQGRRPRAGHLGGPGWAVHLRQLLACPGRLRRAARHPRDPGVPSARGRCSLPGPRASTRWASAPEVGVGGHRTCGGSCWPGRSRSWTPGCIPGRHSRPPPHSPGERARIDAGARAPPPCTPPSGASE